MISWVEGLSSLSKNSESYVLLTVLETKGSTPRDTGTKMVVTDNQLYDTIGGGALEFAAIQKARELLSEGKQTQETMTFNLSKDLKQCCGGVVSVFFEVFLTNDFKIVLFGAGHIGTALINILGELDCQVNWFDSRPELFPDVVAPHIQMKVMDNPELAVEACDKSSYFIVMTHDHALDQALCEAIISRGDSRYCGLIGSNTKGLKFRQRLLKKGFNEQELSKLICPAGSAEVKSKIPMEIAVSVCAEVLKYRDVASACITSSKQLKFN